MPSSSSSGSTRRAPSLDKAPLSNSTSLDGPPQLEKGGETNSSSDQSLNDSDEKGVKAFDVEKGAGGEKEPKLVYVPFVGRKVPRDPYPSLAEAPIIPLNNASIWSVWTFSWIQPLLITGYQRTLYAEDLWTLDEERQSGYLADKLMANFTRRREAIESRNAAIDDGSFKAGAGRKIWWKVKNGVFRMGTGDGKGKVGLAAALSDVFFYTFWSGGAIKVVGDVAQVLSPLVTKALINFATDSYYASRGVPGFTAPSIGLGVGLTFALWFMQLVYAFATHQFFFRSAGTGVMLRGALIAAIYRKSLKLSGKARTVVTNGKLINHISTDVSRIDFCAGFFHMSWTALVQIAIIIVLLLVNLGPSSLAGIGFLFITTPLQGIAMQKMFVLRRKAMVWTDKRAKLMQELLGGMRIIKFFAWEVPYLAKLDSIRSFELGHQRKLLTIRALNSAAAMSIPTLATVISFLVSSQTSGHIQSPAIIFTSLTLFNLLRMPLMLLPMSLSLITDAYNGLGRLTEVFLADEIKETFQVDFSSKYALEVKEASFQWEGPPLEDEVKSKKQIKVAAALVKKKAAADLEKGKGATGSSTPVEVEIMHLDGINLAIPRGSLTAVVGPVGSGKSSLLQGLLGEMRRTKGEVIFSGSIAYCPQPSWIRNASLRENILFGQPFEERRYRQVIKDSCLEADIDMLPSGEFTEIGEKGINLSGGQRARVSIARSLYYNSDIILLDDPLSAVDAHVGAHLFEHAICGSLANKTRVLVTHGLGYLPKTDFIICMLEGKIAQQGTYAELIADESGAFSKMIAEFGSKAADQEEQEQEKRKKKKKDAVAPVKEKAKALMQEEERVTGAVTNTIYRKYLSAANGKVTVPLLLLSLALVQVSQVTGAYWLIWWQENQFNRDMNFYMAIYAALGIIQAVASFAMGLAGVYLGWNASRNLHFRAVDGVLRAPMSFFDTTPLGRIMNRFSKDIDILDNTLNDSLRMFINTFGSVLGSILLIVIIEHYFAIAVAVVIIFYGLAAMFYRASAREIKRIDNILRSSLYGFFSESLSGLSTIRAYGEADKFLKKNEYYIDIENRAYFLSVVNQRWLGLRLDIFGSLLTFLVAIIAVAARNTISPAQTGLILAYVLQISSAFSWMIRQGAEVENDMNSVERLIYYGDHLEQEAAAIVESNRPKGWPEKGAVSIKDVVMSYREGLPAVLKGISLEIAGGEKIGVIGRTGAGKSSIMLALFRIVELTSGSIEIDGIDVSTIGLQDLRDKISIIPQDALLFNGTLRSNLDPFGVYTDEVLWSALKRSWLVDQHSDHKLGTLLPSGEGTPVAASRFTLELAIEDEGLNLSVGERSLVSLARALVKDSQIIVLDEATASVDYATDSRIQQTIREEFTGKTLMTIAHRIKTIINYDKILVMGEGRVEEFDTPINLFRTKGTFYSMCITSGISEEDIVAAAF